MIAFPQHFFSLYINDLAELIKSKHSGVQFGHNNCCILLYADDIALVAENEKDLQDMLDTVYEWCSKWRLKVNVIKSQIVHFRPRKVPCSTQPFIFGSQLLDTVSQYKYLGVIFDEYLSLDIAARTLAAAGARALGKIYSVHKK